MLLRWFFQYGYHINSLQPFLLQACLHGTFANLLNSAIPVKTDIPFFSGLLDSRWRGNGKSESPITVNFAIPEPNCLFAV